MPTADTSRWAMPAGSFSHWASTSDLNSSVCGGVLSPRTVAVPFRSLPVYGRPGWIAGLGAGFSAGRRRAEPGRGAASAGVVEHHLDRKPDREAVRLRLHDVGHHPRPLVELDVGEH